MDDQITREAIELLGFLRNSDHYFTKRGTSVSVSFPYGTNQIVVRHGNKKRLDVRTVQQLRDLLNEARASKHKQAERGMWHCEDGVKIED